MSKLHVPRQKSKVRQRKSRDEDKSIHPEKSLGHAGLTVQALQHQVGNQALQRALIQRQESGRPAFNPLDPAVIGSAVRNVIAESEAPVRRWLDDNLGRLRLLSQEELVSQVRRNVPESNRLADVEIRRLITETANRMGFTVLPGVIPPARSADLTIQIPDAVKKAFSIATGGVNLIDQPDGKLNISVKGLTAHLGRQKLNIGWGGSLGIDIPIGGFELGAKIDKENWEVTLATPGASALPDLSKLASVFQRAESAMRRVVEATANLPNLSDTAAVKAAVEPHIEPIKEAVQALKDIAEAQQGPRVSVGITAGGPLSGGGEAPKVGERPSGFSITATLTLRF